VRLRGTATGRGWGVLALSPAFTRLTCSLACVRAILLKLSRIDLQGMIINIRSTSIM
jgi:hypothetical protein